MSFRTALRARAAGAMARIVFPEGDDPRVRAAAETLRTLGIAEPVLLGPGGIEPYRDERLPAVAEQLRLRRPAAVRDGIHALDLATDPLRFAAGLVSLGLADGCVAGAVAPTADVLRAALWLIGLRDGITAVTSAMYHGLPDGRVLTYTDIAVIPTPTPAQMAAAALAAVRDRRALVGDEPVVAFLSFSTAGSASGPEVERVRQAVALFREVAPGVAADGELQADAALEPAVAARKCPGSRWAGGPTFWSSPRSTPATLPTSSRSGWPGPPRPGRCCRDSRGRCPTCRGGRDRTILWTWRRWWPCKAAAELT